MRNVITPKEGAEIRGLWKEYQDATVRVLEIMRTEGTESSVARRKILAEDKKAGRAITRIKEIYGTGNVVGTKR
jgi:hypothetical protein